VEFRLKAKRELGLDDEGLRVRFGDDFRRVFADYAGPEYPLKHEEATCRTVFGVERTGLGYGQPLDHPLAGAALKDVHAYAWPDPAWMDATKIKAAAEAYGGEYAILGGDWSPFWHDAIDLLGMENLYMKMYDELELIDPWAVPARCTETITALTYFSGAYMAARSTCARASGESFTGL